MSEEKADFKYQELTERVIKVFYAVYNALGHGFLEKVYENALRIELAKKSISAIAENPVQVFYDGKIVGEYFADIVVESCLIVEIKAAKKLILEHEAQLLNYLKATNIEVGLLLNFGPKPEIRRRAFDNERKTKSYLRASA